MKNPNVYLAHVKQKLNEGDFDVHHLEDHLRDVASLAASFAREFENEDWAYLAGLWHDLGKYQLAFQRRIKTKSGYDAEAHLEGSVGKVEHSASGAIYAVNQLGPRGRALAYCIAGHHAGLADWYPAESGMGALSQRLQRQELLDSALVKGLPKNILDQPKLLSKPPSGVDHALWIRMLFSCLVDADFLDTERFMDPIKGESREIAYDWNLFSNSLSDYLAGLCKKAADSPVNRIRRSVLDRCRAVAGWPCGIYTLTVPTGGGKTLSSMSFALEHLICNQKKRIIYVIPYTSIIEQTADIFRDIFGDSVIEHHSNLDFDKQTPKARLASENWDAPLVVTTSVQFFESLFASKPGRCRKLHNIVNSVVVLDEAQLLPPEYLLPILGVMQNLHKAFNVTFLLTTATQPALSKRQLGDIKFKGLEGAREIISDPEELHEQLKRVDVTLPQNLQEKITWEELAKKLQNHDQVLCVVNRRDDCRDLYLKLQPDPSAIHLSALMCGEHRSQTIHKIKERLAGGHPIKVISTQLIEAGVDVDFPVVYRALSGLDSIAQAAGRCNREGRLCQNGKVFIFIPVKPSPIGHLRHAEDAGRECLRLYPDDPLSPSHFDSFFESLYWRKGREGLDRQGICALLKAGNNLEIQFSSASDRFKMISDHQRSVVVRYGESPKWIEMLKRSGEDRWLMRKLQRYVVNIPMQQYFQLINLGDIVELPSGLAIQVSDSLYDDRLGFLANDPAYHDPEELIV